MLNADWNEVEDHAMIRQGQVAPTNNRAAIRQEAIVENRFAIQQDDDNALMGGLVVALKVRKLNQDYAVLHQHATEIQHQKDKLQGEFRSMRSGRNDSASVANSCLKVIGILVSDLAKAQDKPRDEVRQYANSLITRYYDELVEECIEGNFIHSDPRLDPVMMEKRTWYQP